MKTFQYISVFFIAFFFIAGDLSAQDLLYIKNAEVLNVSVISSDQNTIIYKIPGDTINSTFMVSKEEIDSLVFHNGQTFRYQIPEVNVKNIKRNYFGIDLFETFFSFESGVHIGLNNLHLSYERISPSGKTSVTAELLVSTNGNPGGYYWRGGWIIYENLYLNYDPFNYFIRTGINYYPYNYSLKRTGKIRGFTGISILAGSVKTEKYEDYMYIYEDTFLACLVWNIGARWYLTDAVQIKGGVDFSLIPVFVFCTPDLGITIGF